MASGPARALPYELGAHARHRSGRRCAEPSIFTPARPARCSRCSTSLDSENTPKRYTRGRRAQRFSTRQLLPGRRQQAIPPGSARPNGFLRVFRGKCGATWRSARRRCRKCRIDTTSRCSATSARATDQPWPPVRSSLTKGQGQRLSPGRAAYRPTCRRDSAGKSASPLRSAQSWPRLQRQRAGADSFAAFQRSHGKMVVYQRPGHGPGHA
ncbi:hypothetical protein ACPA9J_31600 [Pseudomonas aeruginosa]